ncbi:S-layer homology domain-containing protein [Cohnella sp. GCM10027633]|uniref:S-layer homology domain-containing protein n=1 Tax=unclassified Cohnella TaxID=2636738 RepID=UPI003633AD89
MTHTPSIMKKTAVALLATSMLAGSAVGVASAHSKNDNHGKDNNKNNSHKAEVKVNLNFRDLNEKDWKWAYEHIIRLASQGIFKGDQNGDFRPSANVTRIESIIAAVRLLGLENDATTNPKYTNAKLPFSDAKLVNPAYIGYVAVALENDLFAETETTINPSKPATRLWASVLLVKALKIDVKQYLNDDDSNDVVFKDAKDIPAGSAHYVEAAVANNIITGVEVKGKDNNGRGHGRDDDKWSQTYKVFLPNKPVTRAELATILDRVDQQLPDDGAQAITGSIQSIAGGSIVVKKGDNTSVAVPLDANVFIFRDNVKSPASALKVGDVVLVRTYEGKAVFIEVTKNGTPTQQVAISDVRIGSSNANPSIAKVGDTITLSFKTTEQVSKLGNFKINGSNPKTFVSVGAGNSWTNVATYVVEDSDPVGKVTFQINVQNSAGIYSVTTEATNDQSSVTVVKLAPVISNVGLTSSNADPKKATVGDIVTLTFTTNEAVTKLSNFKINGSNPDVYTSVKQSDNNWKNIATYVIDSSDPKGLLNFQINVKNDAGLYSVTTEATTDGSSITVY